MRTGIFIVRVFNVCCKCDWLMQISYVCRALMLDVMQWTVGLVELA